MEYMTYFKLRGKISSEDYSRLSLEDKTILNLCEMITPENEDEFIEVERTFRNQPFLLRKFLAKQIAETNDKGKITMQYLSDTLINAIKWFKSNRRYKRPIFEALNIILPIIANIYGYVIGRIAKDHIVESTITVSIKEVAEMAKEPLELLNVTYNLTKSNEVYFVNCEQIEKINVKTSNVFDITGENILVVGLGGGSDCIQASMLGKYLLKNCSNVISIRTERTGSQDCSGKIHKIRLVYGVESILSNDVYLCNSTTHGEGRFFEDLPSKMEMNCYLVINRNNDNLYEKIKRVISHIEETTNKKIDTIVGVDTGGDCIYPLNGDTTISHATQDLDRSSMEAIAKFEKNGYKVYTCIVAPGIDSPNGITTKILEESNAMAYYPSAEESKQILETYDKFGMTEIKQKRIGKTPFIWQAALKGETGLVTISLPEYLVMSKENPWIINVIIQNITKSIIFMDTSKVLETIIMYE